MCVSSLRIVKFSANMFLLLQICDDDVQYYIMLHSALSSETIRPGKILSVIYGIVVALQFQPVLVVKHSILSNHIAEVQEIISST